MTLSKAFRPFAKRAFRAGSKFHPTTTGSKTLPQARTIQTPLVSFLPTQHFLRIGPTHSGAATRQEISHIRPILLLGLPPPFLKFPFLSWKLQGRWGHRRRGKDFLVHNARRDLSPHFFPPGATRELGNLSHAKPQGAGPSPRPRNPGPFLKGPS